MGGTAVSADWPGFLRRTVEARLGAGSFVMPITGCEGNINHFDPDGPAEQYGYELARSIGEGYAATVLAALPTVQPSSTTTFGVGHRTVEVGPREIDAAELATAREHAAAYTFDDTHTLTSEDLAAGTPAALKHFADKLLRVAADREPRRFTTAAMRIGDVVVVNLPGEPFVEIGLTIRHEYLRGYTGVVAVLNDTSPVYIPNRANFGRGGYETTPRCSPQAIDMADHLLAAVQGLVQEMC